MLAANESSQTILEPIQYMEEKPFEIVKNLKIRKSKLTTKKGSRRKTILKGAKAGKLKRKAQLPSKIKSELETSCLENYEQEDIRNKSNDPLLTPQLVVKCEISEDELESFYEGEEENEISTDLDEDANFCIDDYEEDDEEDYEIKNIKKKLSKSAFENIKEEFDEEDNELLIKLKAKTGRGNYKKTKKPRLKDCHETCKHKCTTKFNRQQRLDMYNFYWQLSQEDKIDFIRTHVRKAVSKHMRSKNIRNNCCYFLKYYNIADTAPISEASEAVRGIIFGDDDLIKVCHKFFNGTLKISKDEIKVAFEDFELKPERIKRPLKDKKTEEKPKLAEKISREIQSSQQYLDPETGDLSDKKPRKRRKPGEPLPERFPKPIQCHIRCKFKCHEKFSEKERKQICDIFWSLDYKRRKDFILSRIETTDIKTPTTPEFRTSNRPLRAYQTKFYLRSGIKSENTRVCKHFMLNTLCITRHFVENAIEFADKTTGAYTGADLRGLNSTHNKMNEERKSVILEHINSYPFWLPNKKSKIKYLPHSLTIRKMFEAYKKICLTKQIEAISVNSYYKIFHNDFRILFLANPQTKKGRGFFKSNPNMSHYTGDEPGGCWFNSKSALQDVEAIAQKKFVSFESRRLSSALPQDCDTLQTSGSSALALNLAQNALKLNANPNISSIGIKSDLSQASYVNLAYKTFMQMSE